MLADNKLGDVGLEALYRWQLRRGAAGLPLPEVDHDESDHPPEAALLREFDVPQEFSTQPLSAALAYLEARIRSGGSTTVCRVKVVVVGDGAAGKSSLVDRLVHGTFDQHKVMTDGVFMGTFASSHLPSRRTGTMQFHTVAHKITRWHIHTHIHTHALMHSVARHC